MTTPCDLLDDFLAHDLEGGERARFVEHLPSCADCRQSVAAEQQFESLLTTAVEQEPVPPGVVGTIERRLTQRRRMRRAGIAAGLAASVAAIWLVGRPRPLTTEPDRTPVEDAPAIAAVRVRFPAGDVIAVSEKIDAQNVTFLWVHPTLPLNTERSLP